ncbi:MAG TPA: hypothetical protein VLH86_04705 [Patescibacteria group bacterium]|nr:hypothetical protein [Patescibacteria group bacterium]
MVVFTERRTLKTALLRDPYATCVVCEAPVGAGEVTAGSLDAYGNQAFACTAHLLANRRQWIIFWAAFDTQQRHIRKQQVAAR